MGGLGTYADRVGWQDGIRASEDRFEGPVAVVVDDPVEDQRERPGWLSSVEVAGEACLGFVDEGFGFMGTQSPLDRCEAVVESS